MLRYVCFISRSAIGAFVELPLSTIFVTVIANSVPLSPYSAGWAAIKAHPYFQGIDWTQLRVPEVSFPKNPIAVISSYLLLAISHEIP